MTTERLPQAAPKRSPLRLTALLSLALAALPALAQATPQNDPVSPAGAEVSAALPASPASTVSGARARADAAATATLAALLPHLAASDTIPLMDRSAMFAGDLGRLMAAYDAGQGAPLGADSDPGSSKNQSSLLSRAMSLLGTPYRWGGSSPEGGFDCSGLVSYVFRTALGIELPRVSREMASITNGQAIERSALSVGDLVFFGRNGKRIDHVGIYVGEGRFLHAPSRGKDVRVDTLSTGYWSGKFLSARRVEM